MEWSSSIEAMKLLEKQTGQKNPRLTSKPKLRTDCYGYMAAYQTLAQGRGYSEAGLQPFRITDIKAYAEVYCVDMGAPAQKLLRILQALDRTYLEWWGKRHNQRAKGIHG